MSMTVRIVLEGLEDVSLLQEAFDALGIAFEASKTGASTGADGRAMGRAWIDRRPVAVHRGPEGRLVFTGDSDWRRFQKKDFQDRLRQQYSLAAVRRRIDEMGYQLGEVETLRDGTVKVVARSWR